METRLTRREVLRAATISVGGMLLAACQPQVVKETVVVPGTPQTVEKVVTPTPLPKSTGPVTVSFWHVWGGVRLPDIERLTKDFQDLHPEITVDATLVSQDGLGEKYLTAIAGGEPPDVIQITGDFPAFAAKGVLLGLDNYIAQAQIKPKDIWYDFEFDSAAWEGKTYGLPLNAAGGSTILFWNKDHFRQADLDPDKPPKTWQELEAVAAKLTKVEQGKLVRGGIDLFRTMNEFSNAWLTLNNGALLSPDGRKVSFDSPEGLQTLEWCVGLNDRLYGGYQNIRAFAGDAGNVRVAWYNGLESMLVDGVWLFEMAAKEKPDLEYGSGDMPYNAANPDAKFVLPVSTCWKYAIPKLAKQPDAAWEFILYACGGDGSLNFHKAQLRPAAAKKINEDPYFEEKNPHWATVLRALSNVKVVALTPVQSQITTILQQMTEQALMHKKTPSDALKWAAGEVQKAIDGYWAKQ